MKKGIKRLIAALLCVTTTLTCVGIGSVNVAGATGVYKTVDVVSTTGSTKSITELTKGDEYKVRDILIDVNNKSVNRMASAHFQIIWGNSNTANTAVNEDFVRGNLTNLENIRTFYIERLGMDDICYSMNGAVSGKYKTNLYISNTGLASINSAFADDWAYMSADGQGFAYLFLNPDAMRVDAPSWVVPHELAHVFTHHQGGTIDYAWYEATANWFRDQYLGSEYYAYGGRTYGPDSDFFAPYMINGEYYVPHMLNWYDTWPLLLYISENPDNINGLGLSFMKRFFSDTGSYSSMYDKIEKLSGVSIKTILGNMTKRLATMDFSRQPYYLEELNNTLNYDSANYGKIYTTLKSADSKGYQAVNTNDAPMQTGFNIVPLNVDLSKDVLKVDFVDTSNVSGSDFRTSLVTRTADYTTRYSNMISGSGSAEIALRGDEVEAYLVVCATPNVLKSYQVDWDSKETDTDTRYTYKVKITAEDAKQTTKETTTETTTKETTTQKETTTEATTKAPVGDNAMMGTYVFGTGANSGDFNVTAKKMTVGNVQFDLRDMKAAEARSRKNDGHTNIVFTIGSSTDVTIASTGKGMVAVDAGGTEYAFAVGEQMVTLPAGTYTIMGADAGSNSVITKMVLAKAGSEPQKPTTQSTTEATTESTTKATTESTTKATTESTTEGTTEESKLKGDVDLNGVVDKLDVALVLKHISDAIKLSGQGLANADCDGKKGVAIGDAIYILKLLPADRERTYVAAKKYSATDILTDPNFIVSGSTATKNDQIKIDENGYIDFGIADNAVVTIEFKCGSSDAAKSAAISMYDQTSNWLYGKQAAENLVVTGLGNGFYRITAQQQGGTTAQIISITVEYK